VDCKILETQFKVEHKILAALNKIFSSTL